MAIVTTDDKKFCFLVDTGASFNVLLKEAYSEDEEAFSRSGKSDYLLGVDGMPQHVFIVNGEISLGGHNFSTEFAVMNSTESLRSLMIISGQQFDGALSADFFMCNGLVIDFRECSIHD